MDPHGLLYLGGPVDYAEHDVGRDWRHWPEWSQLGGLVPYCPRCRCVGLADEEIIEQNRVALLGARIAVLDLRSHSIGTPIEMFWRLWEQRNSAILIAKPGSVFIRYTVERFPAVLVETPGEALLKAAAVMGVHL